PIPVYTRDPRAIAIVLAQELSKIMKQQLAVRSADYVEPSQATIGRFDVPAGATVPPLANTAPFRAGTVSLRMPSSPIPR
ncbi:MAG TPA: hypothetical protein VG095_07765, partial [Chthoniobacterales bacterium]|nr:hypothetical protein [Chthoniobacterales bacterium]